MKIQRFIPALKVFDLVLSYCHTWRRVGYLPRIIHPRSFNEHLLHRKMHFGPNLDIAKKLTDKFQFKKYLHQIGLANLAVPSLGVYASAVEISDILLPAPCIIKPTHSSGKMIIIESAASRKLSKDEVSEIEAWMKEDYYLRGREPNYRGLEPKIIVEPLMRDQLGKLPDDYKVFCVRGKPIFVQVDSGRFISHMRQVYTPNWELTEIKWCYPRASKPIEKPGALEPALEAARILSEPFEFCRVDFYFLDDSQFKVGEVTFFPENCAGRFDPIDGDFKLGDIIANVQKNSSLEEASPRK